MRKSQLYGRRWRKARREYLTDNPLCKMCPQEGRDTPATEVDHIVKHNLDPELFWDVDNWQGLCAYHHRRTKAQMERSGRIKGHNIDGSPVDKNHSWYQV